MNALTGEFIHAAGSQAALLGLAAVVGLSTVAAVCGVLARRRAALRHAILLSGLLSCLAVPVVALLLPRVAGALVSLRVLPPEPVPTNDPVPTNYIVKELAGVARTNVDITRTTPETVQESRGFPSSQFLTATSPNRRPGGTTWPAAIVLGWLTGTCVLLLCTLRAWRTVRRIRCSAKPFAARPQTLVFVERRLALSLGGQIPLILLSDRVRTPVVVGVLKPAILLPVAGMVEIEEDELIDILIHETAHIRRCDHLVIIAQAIARCLFWPIPSVHWLNHQLQTSREEICDNYVLLGSNPVRYGQTLLNLAQAAYEQRRLGAAVGMLRRGALESRIAGLIDLRRDKTLRLSRVRAFAIGALFLLGCVLVCGTRLVAQSKIHSNLPIAGSGTGDDESRNGPSPAAGHAAANPAHDAADTIVGTLVAEGKPVSGCTIYAFDGPRLLKDLFKTDERGQFRAPKAWRDTDHFLSSVAWEHDRIGWFDFYVHQRADKGGQKLDNGKFTITLLPLSHRISGRLVDESDRPLAGIPVRIDTLNHRVNLLSTHWSERQVNGKKLLPGAITDRQGRFELRAPAETSLIVGVNHPDWLQMRFPVDRDATDIGTKKLPAAATVIGRVVDSRDGEPVVGARIAAQAIVATLSGAWGTGVTDRDGRYRIGGLAAGKFNVYFDECSDKTLTARAHAGILLTAGSTLRADFSVTEARRLSGRVVGIADRNPIRNCTVSYYGPVRPRKGGAALSTQTNERGEFFLYVPPGSGYLFIGDERERGRQSELDVQVRPDRDPPPVVLEAGPKTESSRIRILVNEPVGRKFGATAGDPGNSSIERGRRSHAADAGPEESVEAAVVALNSLGGRVRFEETAAGRRVLEIDLFKTDVTDEGLTHLKPLATARSLTLHGTNVTDAGIQHVKRMTGLGALFIGDTPITDATLADVQGLHRLEYLGLQNTRITDAGLVHVKGLTKLTMLLLDQTAVSDEGLRLIQLNGLPRLRALSLGRTRITDAGMKYVSGLTNLLDLRVDGTAVGDAGLEQLKGLSALETLVLNTTHITDAGLVSLKGLTTLKSLGLSQTNVTDAGLQHLKSLTHLRSLTLDKTKATDEGIRILRAAIPGCKIFH